MHLGALQFGGVRPQLLQHPQAVGSAAASGSMFNTHKWATVGTGVGELVSTTPSISSRLLAASVLTSSTYLPASAKARAAAADSEVLPTPPLPVKNRWRVGWVKNSGD